MSKSGFKDPIAPKPGKKKRSPWDFRCPPYDERTSSYISAGNHYGVGYKQPVGRKGNPSKNAPTLPYGRINTMKTSYVPPEVLEQEMVE